MIVCVISKEASNLSKYMAEMLGDNNQEVFIDTVAPHVMDKVIEFLMYHANNPMKEISKPITTNVIKDIVGEWDVNYIALEKDQELLIDLIIAANYLHCQTLLDLGILKLATMIKDKEPTEVKKLFHIDLDISPEEEKQVREENMWVFEVGNETK